MKRLLGMMGTSILAMFVLSACSQHDDGVNSPLSMKDAERAAIAVSSNTPCVSLIAGQSIDAGSICFEQMNDQLKVTFTVTGDWMLDEAQLWIGTDQNGYPKAKNGNPIPGQFPFPSGSIDAQSYIFYIPFSYLGYTGGAACYYVMAHASISRPLGTDPQTYQQETGWGQGDRVTQRGNWATRFQICLDDFDPDGDPDGDSETAFAYAGDAARCFITDGFSRWGWTNGAFTPGNYTLPLWAGAGQCDLTNGTNVGNVTVLYLNGSANVSYSTNPPYLLTAVHFYAGNAMYPMNNGTPTVAPGQYPYVVSGISTNTHSFQVGGLGGSIYIIAHADVSGF
jgi:hypothetical protein